MGEMESIALVVRFDVDVDELLADQNIWGTGVEVCCIAKVNTATLVRNVEWLMGILSLYHDIW